MCNNVGIRDKTITDKLMCKVNKQNYPFCRLQLAVETFGHSNCYQLNKIHQKSPKLLSQRIRKHYYKTLETSVINSPSSPLSLGIM